MNLLFPEYGVLIPVIGDNAILFPSPISFLLNDTFIIASSFCALIVPNKLILLSSLIISASDSVFICDAKSQIFS